MITEDYVSFETAKLLKEKGFDEECSYWYYDDANEPYRLCDTWRKDSWLEVSNGYISFIHAPTLQMAMKWLREVHNLHCSVDYDYVLGWYCQITSLKETVEYDYEEMKHYHPDKDNGFSSSEEACEAAIKYCLENLI